MRKRIFLTATLLAALLCRAEENFPAPQDLPVQTNLPDVMTMDDGTKVTTPEQWAKRREEIKAVLEHYELGHPPPPPGNVKGSVIRSQTFLDGTVQYRLVHISFGPEQNPGINIAVYTPPGPGPFPTIVNPVSFNTPGLNFTNPPVTTTNQKANANAPVDPAKTVLELTNIVGRGYAIVIYHHTECGIDKWTYRKDAYYPAYPDADWGEMMGWAWGLSRIVDYLETQPFVDKGKIMAVGHSRRGKIVMTAAMFDDRIALVAPGGSGCMGTSAYRFCGPDRGGKEGIEEMIRQHYFWYSANFEQFSNRVYQVPFDAHWAAALIAPRALLAVDATDDEFCVPNAVKQTYLATKPVYELLGHPDAIGVHIENHKHSMAATDWAAILDFADQQLRGINHNQTFDQFLPDADVFPTVKDLPSHPEMPDPLVTQAGVKVTTPEQWQHRREEMKQLMVEYVYGHMPPPPGNVTGHELRSGQLTNGLANWRLVHLTFGASNQIGFDIRIFSPTLTNGIQAPFPTIVHPAFFDGEKEGLQYSEAFRRGYAVVDFYYPQLGADETNYRTTGPFPAYPGYDWNDIASWTWGISRCADYLETDPATDKSKLIVLGLSRLGQSAALAGALDDRFALVAQVGGGSAFRFSGKTRGGKQGLEDIVKVKPYWFGPRLPEFSGQVEKLPFDYHWLPALTAPRYYILCNGTDDQYVNGKAAVETYLGAKPVYDFLGVPDNIGVNFRPGKHGMPPSDWVAVLDFADQKLRGINVPRRFDEIPPAEQLH